MHTRKFEKKKTNVRTNRDYDIYLINGEGRDWIVRNLTFDDRLEFSIRIDDTIEGKKIFRRRDIFACPKPVFAGRYLNSSRG